MPLDDCEPGRQERGRHHTGEDYYKRARVLVRVDKPVPARAWLVVTYFDRGMPSSDSRGPAVRLSTSGALHV
jgi:hypothetical protein